MNLELVTDKWENKKIFIDYSVLNFIKIVFFIVFVGWAKTTSVKP